MRTIIITTPTGEVELLPVPRNDLKKFRDSLVKIAAHWITAEFGAGDAVLDKKCWAEMKKAIAMLPRKDNPAIGWDDLDAIANDYEQLEKLFFAQEYNARWVMGDGGGFYRFESNEYKPCLLCEVHCFVPMGILQEAYRLSSKASTQA